MDWKKSVEERFVHQQLLGEKLLDYVRNDEGTLMNEDDPIFLDRFQHCLKYLNLEFDRYDMAFMPLASSGTEKHVCIRTGRVHLKGGVCEKNGKTLVKGEKNPWRMSLLAKRYTYQPGQLIFDPFMGSDSTGVGALRTGRAFFGVEIQRSTFYGALHVLLAAELSNILLGTEDFAEDADEQDEKELEAEVQDEK
eukprot:gene7326-8721_t